MQLSISCDIVSKPPLFSTAHAHEALPQTCRQHRDAEDQCISLMTRRSTRLWTMHAYLRWYLPAIRQSLYWIGLVWNAGAASQAQGYCDKHRIFTFHASCSLSGPTLPQEVVQASTGCFMPARGVFEALHGVRAV